ncbi:MAG: 2-hydroxyacyl-CoA dehydratase family protein [Oscillospiraceae bacterium]|nr:2-hydroxyacyl-CoA dehydratase family protein [Oscillospiraceae bacterium]
MDKLKNLLDRCLKITSDPLREAERFLSDGQRIVGCMPYFCPEELIHAAGMMPFGMWGAEIRAADSKRYFPSFFCSLLHTTLELGIIGAYKGFSAVMIPILCDSLKCMGANWEAGVSDIPVIPVAHAQNRKITAGIEFTVSQYRKIQKCLEEISGRTVTDDQIAASVRIYNENRAAGRRFLTALKKRPETLSPSERCAAMKCGYFIPVKEHTEILNNLAECLEHSPVTVRKGARIVTTGMVADNFGLLALLESCGVSVADDQVTQESLRYRQDTPATFDPVYGLALRIGETEGCAVLYDPGKKRGEMLINLVKESGANGVLFTSTKFCDPEEYDYVPIKRMLDAEGIQSLLIETDMQTGFSERARTALETFCEILR